MDKQALAMLIPILALSIPAMAVLFGGLLKLQKAKQTPDTGLLEELEHMRGELSMVRTELAEVQERLDFAERMLTARSSAQPDA